MSLLGSNPSQINLNLTSVFKVKIIDSQYDIASLRPLDECLSSILILLNVVRSQCRPMENLMEIIGYGGDLEGLLTIINNRFMEVQWAFRLLEAIHNKQLQRMSGMDSISESARAQRNHEARLAVLLLFF